MFEVAPFTRPLCSSPTLLISRQAVMYLHNGGLLYDGEHKEYYHFQQDFDFKRWLSVGYRIIGKKLTDLNFAVLKKFFVRLGDAKVYLFQLVSCGHCYCCRHSRIIEFAHRCTCESAVSPNLPLFITLTYDNKSIPMSPDGKKRGTFTENRKFGHLFYRDVQLFLDRLRKHFLRHPNIFTQNYDNKFRYVCVGEYGKKSGHPHYHLILWGYPYALRNYSDLNLKEVIRHDIEICWPYSNWDALDKQARLDPKKDWLQIARNCAAYVSKYIGKTSPNGRKGFLHSSNRGGGIGSKYVKDNLYYYRTHPSVNSIEVISPHKSREEVLIMGKYYSQLVFPSPSRLLAKYGYKKYFDALVQRSRVDISHYRRGSFARKERVEYWQSLLDNYRLSSSKDWTHFYDLETAPAHSYQSCLIHNHTHSHKYPQVHDDNLFIALSTEQILQELSLICYRVFFIDGLNYDWLEKQRLKHLQSCCINHYDDAFIEIKTNEIKKKHSKLYSNETL